MPDINSSTIESDINQNITSNNQKQNKASDLRRILTSILNWVRGTETQIAVPSGSPLDSVKIYNVSTVGTYTNFGGVVVTSEDISDGLVQIRLVEGVWTKVITPINLAPYALNDDVMPTVVEVNDGGVFTIGNSNNSYVGVLTNAGVRANNETFLHDAILDKIEAWAVLAGIVRIKLYRVIEGELVQYWQQNFTLTLGANTFLAGTHFDAIQVYKDGMIGFYANNTGTGTQTAKIGYIVEPPGSFILTTTNNDNGDIVDTSVTSTTKFGIKATYSFLSLKQRISDIDQKIEEPVPPVKLEESLALINRFDLTSATQNQALNASAVPSAATGIAYSGLIDVSALATGDPITVSDGRISNLAFFYDGSGVFISGSKVSGTPVGTTPGPMTFTKPSGAHGMRLNINMVQTPLAKYMVFFSPSLPDIYIAYESTPTNIKYLIPWLYQPKSPVDIAPNNRLKGKRGLVSGDSITEGIGTTKTYWQYIAEWAGLASVHNDGKSGTGLVKPFSGNSGIVNRVGAWPAAANIDFISLMGIMNDGTNSFTLGAGTTHPNGLPLGTFADSTPDKKEASVYGAMHWICQYIQTNYPLTPTVFIISTPRNQTASVQAAGSQECWGKAKWFEAWVTAIKEVCGNYSIPCLDLYHESNLKPWVAANNAAYFDASDGIHPNAAGHEVLAQKVFHFWQQYV